ncbi:RNA cap guanine-N2 methyltransferase-domain-containing protein [Triangularia verruculosa]|uniref:Trimethylguanosine synthase n=1 Tax=Triangularia verruculosa TaxID=2587418 RepID=A0AAN6XX75_9PEZI|nr:RNA cap guanine-N2 methyltransferase-domain-containing protein [Triangularia verruculosa]
MGNEQSVPEDISESESPARWKEGSTPPRPPRSPIKRAASSRPLGTIIQPHSSRVSKRTSKKRKGDKKNGRELMLDEKQIDVPETSIEPVLEPEQEPEQIKMSIMKPVDGKLPLTDECLHYDDVLEVPSNLQKYFHQRYSIFNFYDHDIRLTNDAWFGVTPEPLASRLASDLPSHLYSTPRRTTIVDLFGGAGGNTIAFALSGKWDHVISIERDASTLACAQHNAEVYGVAEYITFIHGDCLDFLDRLKNHPETLDPSLREKCSIDDTVLFASPPWGGVDYKEQEVFDLSTMEPYNLEVLHQACSPMEHVLYLPRTSDLRQIAKLAPEGEQIEVVQYCMEGASKAMVALIPAAASQTT